MANETTTIKISKEVQEQLKELRLNNESYSSIIQRLLDSNEDDALKLKAYETTLTNQWILPNPFTLKGVENLLSRNMFNEVPRIIFSIVPTFFEFTMLARKEISTYSDSEMELFVEKSELLIKNIQLFLKDMNLDESKEFDKSLKWNMDIYCGYLANNIGKKDEYMDIYGYIIEKYKDEI